MPEPHTKVLDKWQTSSQYWDKYRTLITQMFAPLSKALVEEAHVGTGQNVLDIGGGAGEPSLTISSNVGPTGSVMFTDPVAGMVETTRAEAARRGLANIQFRQCSADDLPFPDNTFDAAVARLSAMFFPDPAAAIREAVRVIRHGGYVAFVVWGVKEANPFFTTPSDVIERFIELPAENADEPDPFRFSATGELAAILKNGGATDVIERQFNFQIKAPISFEQFWQMRSEMSTHLREAIARLTSGQLPIVKQAVADATRSYFGDDVMNFPALVLVVSGRKSHDN